MTPVFILEFIAALYLVIITHEFGHFVACRICKVPVEEFGLGLPPRLVKLFTSHGTDFTLNWIPLGGFVRPKGEMDITVRDGLAVAPALVRIFVAACGPTMNLILAVLLYSISFLVVGEPDPARLNVVEIQGVINASPAEQAGLQAGDIILSMNGEAMQSTDQAHTYIYGNLDQIILMQIQRGEEQLEISITPLSSRVEAGLYATGISLGIPTIPVNPFKAVLRGFQATGEHIRLLFEMLGQLVTGKLPSEGVQFVGPIGMGKMYVQIRQTDSGSGVFSLIDALGFFITVSISLGIMNLLPIPALDGGRMLLAGGELIIRRRLPAKAENWMNYVSYSLLLILLILISANDLIGLFLHSKP